MKSRRQIPLAKRMRPIGRRLRSSATLWRPVSLIWRKRSRSAPRIFVGRGLTIARSVFSPRISLQFNCNIRLRQPAAGGRRTTAVTIFQRRHSDDRRTSLITHLRSRELVERRRSTLRTVQAEVVQWRTTRTISFSQLVRALRSNSVRWSVRQAAPQLAFRSAGRLDSEKPVQHGAVSELRAPKRFAWRIGPRGSARTPVAETHGPKNPAAPLAKPFSAPELVWRSEDPSQALHEIERGIVSAVPLQMPVASSRTMPFEQLSETVERSARQALDPALLDRVAEDVIGRVERRIRIERERRGV